jgi:hypothetical protein
MSILLLCLILEFIWIGCLFIPNVLEFLVGKSEGKTPLLRHDYTWTYNIDMKQDMINNEVCVLVLYQ